MSDRQYKTEGISFTHLEETISFYTRNDFAVINHLLIGNFDCLWKYALLAYDDNRGIVGEYESGIRTIESDYDIKWLNCLKKRMLNDFDDAAKETIIKNAQSDIANIMDAMCPAKEPLHLYRTSWIDKEYASENDFSYSREYKALQFDVGSILEIKQYPLVP